MSNFNIRILYEIKKLVDNIEISTSDIDLSYNLLKSTDIIFPTVLVAKIISNKKDVLMIVDNIIYHMSNDLNNIKEFVAKLELVYLLNDDITQLYKLVGNFILDNYKQFLINSSIKILKKFYSYGKTKELRLRNKLQEQYVISSITFLELYSKCFIKAPTGFGKTHIYYKIIRKMGLKKILILTPRLLLNEQILDDKYSHYIRDLNYKICHFSHLTNQEKTTRFSSTVKKSKYIITSCYQSLKTILDHIETNNIHFDLIIFDEAHWIEPTNEPFKTICTKTNYKIFGSATPTDIVYTQTDVFGKVIEKVKVHQLINAGVLCDIQTIIKKLDNNKKEYHNLSDLIVNTMTNYNKRKGIIYVNTCANAENLYKLMKKQDVIHTYIYVSKQIDPIDESDTSIKEFETNTNPCVIISVGKIGYGYDNDFIDFICLGDPRQSAIDIRQIIGRGIRSNKQTYPNKLLHLLIPLYQDQFKTYSENKHLKLYLDYIIGECGHDIIIKSNEPRISDGSGNSNIEGLEYDGDSIPTEILNEYCTTGYNKFTDYIRFLRVNSIHSELEYNNLKDRYDWICGLGQIHEKYPKFCFRDFHPRSQDYYWNKNDCLTAIQNATNKLIELIGRDKFKKYDFNDRLIQLRQIDNKIPLVDIEYYYPKCK